MGRPYGSDAAVRGKQLRTPNVCARLAAEGGDVLDGTPREFSALLKSDLAHWGAIVKQTAATVD
jgi:tripartite-type tricarboxylate transporter receptor subunit TctC